MKNKKILVLDFDGVIHSYTSGWKGVDVIPDPPVSGIKELIDKLKDDFHIYIVSSRCSDEKGCLAIEKYLFENNIFYNRVQADKPPAYLTIDDRALTFNGNCDEIYEQIKSFKPWNK